MLYSGPKAFFYALSKSSRLKRLASRYGLATPHGFARRFIAGETIQEAIGVARQLQQKQLLLTLDYLGESVRTRDAATAATAEYLRLVDVIVAAGIERNLSLKLTQLGVDVDRATCVDNLRRILEPAERQGFFVRIDMENSPYIDRTLRVLETLWQQGHRGIGTVVQSCLLRTPRDVQRLNELGVRVRLVKGAYKEPKTVAFQDKSQVDAAFVELMRELLDRGAFPAIATHDVAMIEATKAYAAKRGYAKERFEFQMLYGIRRDLQASLTTAGYGMRIYIPFGREWFPYSMRRLGERPSNVAWVVRGIVGEK